MGNDGIPISIGLIISGVVLGALIMVGFIVAAMLLA